MLATTKTVTLSRAQRDAVLKYIEWEVEHEVCNIELEADVEEMRRVARWLTAAFRIREQICWEDPPAEHVDAFEIEVDEDVAWLAREYLGPHVQENMNGDEDEESYAVRFPDMPAEQAEMLDALTAAHHQRDLDALAAVQLIGEAA